MSEKQDLHTDIYKEDEQLEAVHLINDSGNGSSSNPIEIQKDEVAKQNKKPVSDYLGHREINGTRIGTYKSKALEMISVPNGLIAVAISSVSLVIITALCLILIPWQQSISGRGKVIIFSPMERPQHLEAPIPGQIFKWFVRDGQTVNTGDPIVELREVDPKFLAPKQLEQLNARKQALVAKKEAAESKAMALKSQIKSLQLSRKSQVASTERKRAQTHDKLDAAKQAVTAAEQNLKTAELNLSRRKSLFDKGLRSKRDYELAELDFVRAKTNLERALANLEVANKETEVAHLIISQTEADTLAKLDSTKASIAAAKESVASTEAEIQKLSIEIGHLSSRIEQRVLEAPCCGKVVRLLKAGAGETVKAGEELAVIAPETNDLAAELIVEGHDAPLIAPERPVRLQFAGWPAVQFTGWPSVAVGTFPGKVSVVDAIDDGTGRFRIIVVPDLKAVKLRKDEEWPDRQFLRPGSEVHGWVMLNTVSLGFELWRQFNAFPPTIEKVQKRKSDGDIKRNIVK